MGETVGDRDVDAEPPWMGPRRVSPMHPPSTASPYEAPPQHYQLNLTPPINILGRPGVKVGPNRLVVSA